MKIFTRFKYLVTGIGLYKIGEVAYDVGSEVYFRQFKERQPLIERYGKCYALVTDSTGDLGYAYAEQLAKKQFNLVLISKDNENLKQQKQSLENEFGIQVKTVEFDFNKSDNNKNLQKVYDDLKGLDIGILVNNFETYQLQKFDHLYQNEIKSAINSGILSSALLLNTFIPKMLERSEKSLVVNIGSEIGDSPAGFMSLFSATKAFNNTLSRSLKQEYGDRIDIVTALPGPLDTSAYNTMFTTQNEEGVSYFSRLYHSLINSFILSSPRDSAEATLDIADSKSEVPGTAKHLVYNIGQRVLSVFPWRTWSFSQSYDVFGEKRTSNIPLTGVEETVPEETIPQEIELPPPTIVYVEKIVPTVVTEIQIKEEAIDIPRDITRTLSNDFLLPFITKDYTNHISNLSKN